MCGCTTAQQRSSGEPKPPKDLTPLERQLAAQPEDAKVNLELGDRATAMGDYLRAEQYFQRAQALGTPAAQIVPRILSVLVMARRYDEALELCHRQLATQPEDRATRLVEAAILEALDRSRDAERDLTTLVRTRPKDPYPYLALGKLYRDSYHDADRARRMFQRYLALDPKGQEAESVRYQLEDWLPPSPDSVVPAPPNPDAPSAPPASGTLGTSGAADAPRTSGTSGAAGAPRTPGTSGTLGTVSAPGTSATSGTPRTPGTSGTSGTVSAPGTSGTVSAPRTSSTSGTTGARRTSGTSGTPRTPGMSGTSGTAGAPRTPGTSGTPGAAGMPDATNPPSPTEPTP